MEVILNFDIKHFTDTGLALSETPKHLYQGQADTFGSGIYTYVKVQCRFASS